MFHNLIKYIKIESSTSLMPNTEWFRKITFFNNRFFCGGLLCLWTI